MSDFKHIKIGDASASSSQPEEDEVVIVAGRKADKSSRDMRNNTDAGHVQDPQDDQNATHVQDVQDSRNVPDMHGQKNDAYHPTTLEDLQSAKMPRIQIAVIAVAVVCLIAFAVWYIFF